MVRIDKSIIGKAIFSISVVAITATAGVAGFAQAARPSAAPGNGYGGIGALIQAAVQQFERAVHTATTQFQTDIAKCTTDTGGTPGVVNGLRADSAAAASDFSAQTASPTSFGNMSKFDSHVDAASKNFQKKLDDGDNRAAANFDSVQHAQPNRNAFRKCVNTARNHYSQALNNARQELRKALRGIFS